MQFVSQLVLQFCCDTSCTQNCNVYHATQSTSLAIFLLQQPLHEVESGSTFATIAATLQRIFKAFQSATSLLQLFSQCFYTE
jgi:hypothetical protein